MERNTKRLVNVVGGVNASEHVSIVGGDPTVICFTCYVYILLL